MSKYTMGVAAAALLAATTGSYAQGPGAGPVADQCKSEIAKLCSDKSHEARGVRTCLEGKKAELSDACKKALDTTGGGQGKGPRKG